MSEALPLEQKIPVFPYNFLFLAYNQSATSSFSRTTGIQPSTTWRATDIQPSTTFPAPAAQNAFFPTMFHVQPGTTIFPSRKCQTLVGHCPARVCCILFHVEHRRNGISTKQSPRRHSRLGRRLKICHRQIFLTPRRETLEKPPPSDGQNQMAGVPRRKGSPRDADGEKDLVGGVGAVAGGVDSGGFHHGEAPGHGI